ncbi:Transmembrane domain-containing protein [Spironucleus salmonicida]|uniref:Transmembrane domain-containing protein n=1 Tax=Spironucleus salmonicida TaxID=348837 RepID=A0A9P8LRZ4_9EUKA|nr:Transmembrane domain-containing protein [Spironucleus salmonicida]
MLVIFSLIILSDGDGFYQLNTMQNDNFVIEKDISLTISSSAIINFFNGTLSGARNTLTILSIPGGGMLIQKFTGILSNIRISVETDILDSFRVMEQLSTASFQDTSFKIQSDKITNLAEITFFTQVIESQFRSCDFSIICTPFLKTQYNVYGISKSIQSLKSTSLSVTISITMASTIFGICQDLMGAFPVSVIITAMETTQIYGVSMQTFVDLLNINVKIFGREISLIYGFSQITKTISKSEIMIFISTSSALTHTTIFSICQQLIGNLKNLKITIDLQSNSKTATKITQLSQIVEENADISNIAIQSSLTMTDTPFIAILLAESNVKNIQVSFVSINSTLEMEKCKSQQIAYFFNSLDEVTISMVSLNLSISGSTNGSFSNYGMGKLITNCKFTNISFNCNTHLSYAASAVNYYPLSLKIEAMFMLNMSFCNFITISDGVNVEKSVIFGLAQDMIKANIDHIIIQKNIEISQVSIDKFSGISDLIQQISFNFAVICGQIQLKQQGIINGISQTALKSFFINMLVNFKLISPNNKKCVLLIKEAQDNEIINFVEQSSEIFCQSDVPIISTERNSNMINVYILIGTGKISSPQQISKAEMQSGPGVTKLLQDGKWIVDFRNDGMVRLQDFFTVSIASLAELASPEIPPFIQQELLRVQINIKNQENLCYSECHGIFDGKILTCNQDYSGKNCETHTCPPDFCNKGSTCSAIFGCVCRPGYSGDKCEIDLCTFCIGGATSCDASTGFATCIGDQKSQCFHGQVLDNFCVCSDGYFSIDGICDGFVCKNSQECNGNRCEDGDCHCGDHFGGISCQFCTKSSDKGCKNVCLTGACAQGAGCVYLSGNGGEWECSACKIGWKAPKCQECDSGFKADGELCLKKCAECLTGDCYYLQECMLPPDKCDIKCFSCNAGIAGNRCDECPADKWLYGEVCHNLEDEKIEHGKCIKIALETICFSCAQDYLLVGAQCIFQCLPTNCINGVCQHDQTCRCNQYAVGKQCDSCQAGTGSFLGQCLVRCDGCNGDCFYENGSIVCSSCKDNFQGPSCQGCWAGFINIGAECLELCEKCQGDRCYVDASGRLICAGFCLPGYTGDGCLVCDAANGFVAALGGCLKPCITCAAGTCFYTPGGIRCSSCVGSFTGQQCDACIDGFIFAGGACQVQVTDDGCYRNGAGTLVCASCLPGKVLVGQQCLARCVLPECAGECYDQGPSYFCCSCYLGFILHENKCYPPIPNPNGDCFTLQGQVMCSCYKGYAGPSCDECSELEREGSCYYRNDVATGVCFTNAVDSLDSFCQECQYNYAMPLCTTCSLGYQIDVSGECNDCQPGYTSSNILPADELVVIGVNRCLIPCADCTQGSCFYSGDSIQCGSCSLGHALSHNCFRCEDIFSLLGGYCLQASSTACWKDSSGDYYCPTCGPHRQSFNCTMCSVEATFGPECKQHAVNFPGECFQTATLVTCADSPCLSFDMNIQQCLVCRPGLEHIKGNCGTATAPENDQLRGTCIATANQLFCGECQEGWGGAVCSECTQGYISCDCRTEAFSRCCCPLLQSPTGVCFRNQMGVAECDYCGPRFILVVDQCVVERISPGYMTFVIAVPVLSFLLLLVLLIVILRLSKAGKRKIVVYAKRQIKRIGPHLIFVMLSQALAIIIAIQDVYINDFFMQIAVNIFSMVPFVLVLFLLAVPTYTQFFYNLPSHFFLFILAALLELSFHFVQYQAVSDVVHDFGEQIYKLAGPLVTLFMCVFLAGFRFKSQQKLAVFIAIMLPIFAQILFAIQGTEQLGYFSESSSWNIISGQIMVSIAILLNGAQFYLFDLILGRYGEVGAIGRLSLASFMVNSMVGLTYPSEIIKSILEYDIFLSSLFTQIFFNIVNIVVMMHISAVEFGINLISSAIWAQFITAVGDFKTARDNNYTISLLVIILQAISLVIVFISLLHFNIQSSYWDHRRNRQISDTSKIITGVKAFFKSRKQYKEFFKPAKTNYNQQKSAPTTHNQLLKDMQLNIDSRSITQKQLSAASLMPTTVVQISEQVVTPTSNKQVFYLKNYDTLITKLPAKQNNKEIPQLQLQSEQINQNKITTDPNIRRNMSSLQFK